MRAPSLSELQSDFARAIASDEGMNARELAALPIAPCRGISIRQRLTIYRTAYVLRALESLEEDFPQTSAVLGDEAFAALVRRYMKSNPSRSWTLADLGSGLPGFLKDAEFPWVADLARLEWLRVLAGHAEEVASGTTKGLAEIFDREAEHVVLGLAPSAYLSRFDWAVHEDRSPRQVRLLIFRSTRSGEVHEIELAESRYMLLVELSHSLKLADVPERLAGQTPEEVSEAFRELSSLGLINCRFEKEMTV
jgi:hypothetical protein